MACRNYEGKLFTINAGDSFTRVTPNHKFLVRWSGRPIEKYVTYLMKKGEYFRIGWCQLFQKSGDFHLGQRARLEKADAAWILGVHNSRSAASMEESVLSTRFALPLPQFQSGSEAGHYTQDFLDNFWREVSLWSDLRGNAIELLEHFGRDIEYPIYTGKNGRQGRTTLFVTQACNVIPSMMAVALYGQDADPRVPVWETVEVSEEDYKGPVYSLDVDKHHNYVADGILTNNSIYGFAGATNNALDLTKAEFNCVELPLSVTYRCPKAVVKLANTWVPDIQAHESAPEGKVTHMGYNEGDANKIDVMEPDDSPEEFHERVKARQTARWEGLSAFWRIRFTPDDVILCRNTRPLLGIAKRLRKQGTPCVVEGNHGRAMIALASKWGEDITIGTMLHYLDDYKKDQTAKWTNKTPPRPDKAEDVQEKCAMLCDMVDDFDQDALVREFTKYLENMFGFRQDDRPILRLCSIHRSKGREWQRVFLIGRNQYMPSRYATQPWELQQEDNLAYVAVTRAKWELVEVHVPPPPKPDEPQWWEV
jgi:hypothetical protein